MTAELLEDTLRNDTRKTKFGRVEPLSRPLGSMPITKQILAHADENEEKYKRNLEPIQIGDIPSRPAPEPNYLNLIPGVALGRSIKWTINNWNDPNYKTADFVDAIGTGLWITGITTGLSLVIGSKFYEKMFRY